jgi:hypothetical protein
MNPVSRLSRAFIPTVSTGFSKVRKTVVTSYTAQAIRPALTHSPNIFRRVFTESQRDPSCDLAKQFSKLRVTMNRSGNGGSQHKNSTGKNYFKLLAATAVILSSDLEDTEVKRLKGNTKEIHAILRFIGFDLSKLDPRILGVFKIVGPTISSLDFSNNQYHKIFAPTSEIIKTLAEYFPNIVELNLGNFSLSEVSVEDLLRFKKLEKIVLAKNEKQDDASRRVLHVEVAYSTKTAGRFF